MRSFDSLSRRCYATLAAFTLLLAVAFVLGDSMAPAGRRLAKVTGVDPPAYFAVSHSLLFRQDFDLSAEYQRVKPDDSPFTAVRKETGHAGSQYAVGYSILAMPFLAAGTLVDFLAGNPADGFSRYAILGYCLTNIALTGFGLMALFAFTRGVAEFWGVPSRSAAFYAVFTAGVIFFGTNVGYYAFSPMSHAATFFGSSLFLACWWKVRERTDVPSWALLGLVGGILTISRWQEMFFLVAPLLTDLLSGVAGLVPRLRSRLAYCAVIALCWVPQSLEWKYIFGKFLTIPQGRDFIVLPPAFVAQVLFSTRNGWLIWTPLVVLGLGGLLWAAGRKPRLFLPWIAVIALEIGLVGSLPTTWHGGEGFSARYLTSVAPLIALGMVTLLCLAPRNLRPAVIGAALLCSVFAVVSALQLRLDLVPRSDRLTATEYLTDKFRLLEVRRRKQSVRRAETLLFQGSPSDAVAALEAAEQFGPDRDVLAELSKAYRASGREAEARDAERRLTILLRSRMF